MKLSDGVDIQRHPDDPESARLEIKPLTVNWIAVPLLLELLDGVGEFMEELAAKEAPRKAAAPKKKVRKRNAVPAGRVMLRDFATEKGLDYNRMRYLLKRDNDAPKGQRRSGFSRRALDSWVKRNQNKFP